MGASNRDRANVYRPRPVWIVSIGDYTPRSAPCVGILLQWRQVAVHGRPPRWEGLVAWADGGGELPWTMHVAWKHAAELREMRFSAPPAEAPEWPPRLGRGR